MSTPEVTIVRPKDEGKQAEFQKRLRDIADGIGKEECDFFFEMVELEQLITDIGEEAKRKCSTFDDVNPIGLTGTQRLQITKIQAQSGVRWKDFVNAAIILNARGMLRDI